MADKKEKYDKPIYVVHGGDDFLVSKKCEQIVDGLLTLDEKQMSLLSVEADKITAAEVFDELRTMPFLAKKRVVVLKNADKFISENRSLFEKYFDGPSSCGVLILTVSSWMKTTKLAKKLSQEQYFPIEDIKNNNLTGFIIEYALSRHGKKIDFASARLLGELIGSDAGRLSCEIDKLAVYDLDKKTIDSKDIAALTAGSRFFDAFNIIDAMSSGDAAGAISKLRRMFEADKSTEFTIVGAFAYHFRQMFEAKAMLEKKVNRGQIAKQCRIWGSNEDSFFKRVALLSLRRIGDMLAELGQIDYLVKTGGTDVSSAMEQLVIKCSLINKKALVR